MKRKVVRSLSWAVRRHQLFELKRSRGQRSEVTEWRKQLEQNPENLNQAKIWGRRLLSPVPEENRCNLKLLVKGHRRDFQSIPDNMVNRYSIKGGGGNYKLLVLFSEKRPSWRRFQTELWLLNPQWLHTDQGRVLFSHLLSERFTVRSQAACWSHVDHHCVGGGSRSSITAASHRSSGSWLHSRSRSGQWSYTWHAGRRSPPPRRLRRAAPAPSESCSTTGNGFHTKTWNTAPPTPTPTQASHCLKFTGVPSTQIHFPSSSRSLIPTHAALMKPERNFCQGWRCEVTHSHTESHCLLNNTELTV